MANFRKSIDAIIKEMDEEIRREERQRYGGLNPCALTLKEVGAALWVSDQLCEQGILEVAPWRMRELINKAISRGLGYGVGDGSDE